LRIGARLALALLLAVACGNGGPPDPPNLVLIIADDQGYRDYGFMGSPTVRTPNLDRLASEGVVFSFGYTTSSVCRPTLQTLLTGLYPREWTMRIAQMRRRGSAPTPWGEVARFETLPRILAEHGYASFQAGKHWEGTFTTAGFTDGMTATKDPEQFKGIDGLPGGGGIRIAGADGLRIVRETMDPVYEFIDAHVDSPFLLWFAPYLPHIPHNAPRRHQDLYRDAPVPKTTKLYYSAISWLDEGVGQLLEHLESRGLREKTLVVYMSDNGWQAGDFGLHRNTLLGGPKAKLSLYDLGFRTPIILSWPGRIPEGEVIDRLTSTAHLFPTFLDYAGVPQLPDRAGRSLRPLLEGDSDGPPEIIIGGMETIRTDRPGGELRKGENPETAGGRFLRTPTWHYIWYQDRPHELYNTKADPEEENDVAGENPALTARFRKQIERWDRELKRRAAWRVRRATAGEPTSAPVATATPGAGDIPAHRSDGASRGAGKPPAALPSEDEERMRQLLALGYLTGSEPAPENEGVTTYVRDAAYRGLNLLISGHAPEALLTDMDGRPLHAWRYAFEKVWPDYGKTNWYRSERFWRRVHLFPNGDLLAIFDGLGLIKLDKHSRLLWAYSGKAHHDLFVTEDGFIYVLTHEEIIFPRVSESKPVLEDFITVLDPEGREIRKVSLFKAVENSAYSFLFDRSRTEGDIFHTNTIEVLDHRLEARSEKFRAGNVLVSIHGVHAIGVVDLDKEKMVWGLTGSWRYQHQPTILDNGNLMLFDNLGTAERSSVLEIDPLTGELAWIYQAAEPGEFFTFSCGSAQRLPNGNTLITESDAGRAFELTPDKEIIWEYVNPHRAGQNDELIATLFEVVRLPPAFPLGWLDGG
jgi:arylsulfatase A-like enzyme